jgi:hypothetical protein
VAPSWRNRVSQAVALAAVVATGAVLVGSADYNTLWEGAPRGSRLGGYGVDGIWQWAIWTGVLGCIALLLLLRVLEGLRNHRGADRAWLGQAGVLSVAAAGCCGGASLIARWYWQSLLAMPDDPDGRLFIASGLPVVSAAGAVAGAIALMLAALVFWHRGRVAAPPRAENHPSEFAVGSHGGSVSSDNITAPTNTLTRRVALTAMFAALLVTLGSCSYRSRWESTTVSVRTGKEKWRSTATHGFLEWAIFTFPLGLLATGLLMGAWKLPERDRLSDRRRHATAAILAFLGALCLVVASVVANDSWQPLRAMQAKGVSVIATEKTIESSQLAHVAWGLPIVTIGGVVGALVCLLRVTMLLLERGDTARRG